MKDQERPYLGLLPTRYWISGGTPQRKIFMSGLAQGCIHLIGVDAAARVAGEIIAELNLPSPQAKSMLDIFTDERIERNSSGLQAALAEATRACPIHWPRLDYWKNVFDHLGDRPFLWSKGIFPQERRRSETLPSGFEDAHGNSSRFLLALVREEAPQWPASASGAFARAPAGSANQSQKKVPRDRRRHRANLNERHRSATLKLLEHYVHYSFYAERDRRRIESVGNGAAMILSRDPIERKIEIIWLENLFRHPMWPVAPPLFPGHRCTLLPFLTKRHPLHGAYQMKERGVWVLPN